MCRSTIILCLSGVLLAVGSPCAAGLLDGRGAVLPLEDRFGDPEMARLIETTLRAQLGVIHDLVDPQELRNTLRATRLREPNMMDPEAARRLAEGLDADWFVSSTLHGASRDPVPWITVSARLVRAGSSELAWAGFESISGLDSEGLLGRGRIADLDALARIAVDRMVEELLGPGLTSSRRLPDVETSRPGYLFQRLTAQQVGSVAVIPFDAVTDTDPQLVADAMTNLALAVLHRNGVRLLAPGSVNDILRQRGVLLRGQVDRDARVALHTTYQADRVLTGSVERFDVRGGREDPEPGVEFSARLLDAAGGRILWFDGLERSGAGTFLGAGGERTPGALAEQMMQSMVQGLLEPRKQEAGSTR